MKRILSRRNRRKPERDTVHGQERWLLTYSDMITLLLGLFIILYSVSQIDNQKLTRVAESIRTGFGLGNAFASANSLLDGGTGILDDDVMAPKSVLFRLWERLGFALKSLRTSTKFKLGLAETEELKLTLFTPSLVEGKWNDDPDTVFTLQKLAELTNAMDVEITLRVHIPYAKSINQEGFANSWDFNAHQASRLAMTLSETYGIPRERIAVQAFSDFRSLGKTADNPEKKADQERIEIILRKKDKE